MIIVELIHMLKKKNKLVLISSHIFETLDKVCDKIYLLENNHIEAEYASHEFQTLSDKLKSYVIDHEIKELDL
jgi:ABC-2 type transport system ATP-binding protein